MGRIATQVDEGAYYRSVQYRKPMTVQSYAKTVSDLADLPSDGRRAIKAVRGVILENLPDGYEEKRIDISKSCVRWKKLDDLLDLIGEAVIGEAVARMSVVVDVIALCQHSREGRTRK